MAADGAGERAAAVRLEEERDAELGEREVGDDHADEDGEEGERQRAEAEAGARSGPMYGSATPIAAQASVAVEERSCWGGS